MIGRFGVFGLGMAGILALGLLAACDDGTGPQGVTRGELLGPYMARTFTTESAGVTVDRLSQGARLIIVLRSDGSTTGQLFVPAGGAGGGDLNADLAGLFSFDESTGRVSFEQPVDTFVRDVSFTAGRNGTSGALSEALQQVLRQGGQSVGDVVWGNQLEGRQSVGGTAVHVVLRQYFMALVDRVGSP